MGVKYGRDRSHGCQIVGSGGQKRPKVGLLACLEERAARGHLGRWVRLPLPSCVRQYYPVSVQSVCIILISLPADIAVVSLDMYSVGEARVGRCAMGKDASSCSACIESNWRRWEDDALSFQDCEP